MTEHIELRGARGPEGGSRGGEIVFTGTPAQLRDAPNSLTGEYLRRTERVAA